MTEPTLSDCINYMKQQLKGMEKYPKSYEFNIPYYRKTIEFLKGGRSHGKWLTTQNPNHSPFDNTSEVTYVCSKCTYSSGDRITEYWNFCPNCGASMRKEGEAE